MLILALVIASFDPSLCGETTYGVYSGEKKIGRLVLAVSRVSRSGGAYALTTDFSALLRTPERSALLLLHEEKTFAAEEPHALCSISCESTLTGTRESWRGEVVDGAFVVTTRDRRFTAPVPALTLAEALAPSLFVRSGPAVGLSDAGGRMEVLSRGTEIAGGIELETFTLKEGEAVNTYTADGRLLAGEFAGLHVRREPPGSSIPAITVNTQIAFAGRKAPAERLGRVCFAIPRIDVETTARQRVAGRLKDRLLLEVSEASWEGAAAGLPAPGPPAAEPASIAALARSLGRGLAPRERLAAFARWIGENVRAAEVSGTLPCEEILRARSGDCSERAELFASLCRASGLPARRVTGLLWHDRALHGHAWCEVFADRWVEIDPESGAPVDARHVLLWRRPEARDILRILDASFDVLSIAPASRG